jgi:hypothetical protein
MSQRPAVNAEFSGHELRRWYWLKSELLLMCRALGLPTTGSKPELTERVAAALDKNPIPLAVRSKRAAVMPDTFTLATVIQPGWRCSPALGAFMRDHGGTSFRFNAAVRDFIHTQAGRTLADAVECFRQSIGPTAPARPIIPQNEYNQHTRDFYAAHPGATREQVLAAWKARRGQPWR